MTMHSYVIRAESEAALIALLETAQTGKARPFIFATEAGKSVDPARITFPRPEVLDGDEETSSVTTGFWVCEIRLDAADAELAALAVA
ncbi:hypothetical protein [Parvibaculum sp.]|jgi:hypothetical protein|uniref:hypothetical protein n=1 Tax=Parvibaculum sp. TaxID=2024848 RepID=UPI003C745B44